MSTFAVDNLLETRYKICDDRDLSVMLNHDAHKKSPIWWIGATVALERRCKSIKTSYKSNYSNALSTSNVCSTERIQTSIYFCFHRGKGHDMTHRSVLIIYDLQFFIAWSPLIMHDMMQQSVLIIYDKQYFIATITTFHAWSVKNHLWSLIIHKIHWYDADHRWLVFIAIM